MYFSEGVITEVSVLKGFDAYGIVIGITNKSLVYKYNGKPDENSDGISNEDDFAISGSAWNSVYYSGKYKLILYYDSKGTIISADLLRSN